ncbi:MAG: recombinase family protein [Deltaproteobacteria bacterium]|nr:recombinase family protein [Deltaproteobacteria bacterium]
MRTRTELRRYKTFTIEFHGGVFTGFRNYTHYLVRPDEPIPLQLLRKTHVNIGPPRPKCHPISGQPLMYGQTPFGFKNINGTLIEDPLEQFILKQMREMRQKGSSLNEIARYLTNSGIPTKNGGRWQSNTVNQILSRLNSGSRSF